MNNKNKIDLIEVFRMIGILEALSYIFLIFVAMPMKYIGGILSATQIIGMAHGVLFILYCLSLSIVAKKYPVSTKIMIFGYIASLLPFGPFFYHPMFQKAINSEVE